MINAQNETVKKYTEVASVLETENLLRDLEFTEDLCNERSALTLLALASLKPKEKWSDADSPDLTVHQIMSWMREEWSKDYKENSRETIRRFTLHQFIEAGLVEQNRDCPTRPINSPKWNYSLKQETLKLIRSIGTEEFWSNLSTFNDFRETWKEKIKDPRHMRLLPVHLPDGFDIELSAGGQNSLIKDIVEQFCPRFVPNGHVLYVGDSNKVNEVLDAEKLKNIGIVLKTRGKEPDLIVWDDKREWIFLIEACSSHGPIDVIRKKELEELFAHRNNLVYVSCFPNRKIMQKYLSNLAWETECWCADSPDHMIHLNGSKFFGPYK